MIQTESGSKVLFASGRFSVHLGASACTHWPAGRALILSTGSLGLPELTACAVCGCRASDKCQREKRKTINGDDLLWAMSTLGFEEYVEPLKIYLAKFREVCTRAGGCLFFHGIFSFQTSVLVPGFGLEWPGFCALACTAMPCMRRRPLPGSRQFGMQYLPHTRCRCLLLQYPLFPPAASCCRVRSRRWRSRAAPRGATRTRGMKPIRIISIPAAAREGRNAR